LSCYFDRDRHAYCIILFNADAPILISVFCWDNARFQRIAADVLETLHGKLDIVAQKIANQILAMPFDHSARADQCVDLVAAAPVLS